MNDSLLVPYSLISKEASKQYKKIHQKKKKKNNTTPNYLTLWIFFIGSLPFILGLIY